MPCFVLRSSTTQVIKSKTSCKRRGMIMGAFRNTSSFQGPKNFEDPNCDSFSVAIIGDLHISGNPDEMTLFHEARDQLVQMAQHASDTPRIVQLGDLGNYDKGWPGSSTCFEQSRSFFDSFSLPVALILGNHDLEGDEFETDEENLAAWHKAFGQRHYWSSRIGPALLIGLSTTRFRSNPFSVHEVHIDEEQMEFLESELQKAYETNTPVIMFTHAPIIGSGLKAIQAVHVKNRCAWLNHSSDPTAFTRLVQKYTNIKLWFSGHFHLSQSYPDSISIVGSTAFVLTGVIGDHSSRDGLRHSRLLKGSQHGFELYTVDHDQNSTRLDLRGDWSPGSKPEYLVPEEDLLCDPSSGWLCSQVDCSLSEKVENQVKMSGGQGIWFDAGKNSVLRLQDDVLVEYDVATMAPIGAVFLNIPDNSSIRLVDEQGHEIDAVYGDGSKAVAVEVCDGDGHVLMRTERNDKGMFYQIFQANKWVARKKKEAEEAARAKNTVLA